MPESFINNLNDERIATQQCLTGVTKARIKKYI